MVYKQAPGYSDKATSLFTLDLGSPQDLPDALRGESWVFVQLPLAQLLEEARAVTSRQSFGSVFALDTAGLGDLPADTLIPGESAESPLLIRLCLRWTRPGWPTSPVTPWFQVRHLYRCLAFH